jgi:hypothetical protein
VKRYLSTSDDWLLLIDNADNPKHDILVYMPFGNTGSIIITSRNPEMSEYASHVDTYGVAKYQVEKMTSEEAMVLLEKASHLTLQGDPKTKQDSQALIEELGYLTLAINQAGAYMRIRNCSIGNYLGIFQKQRWYLLETQFSKIGSSYNWTVYKTWEISFKMVEQEDIGELASDLAHVFAYMHYSQIPKEIFRRASDTISFIYEDIDGEEDSEVGRYLVHPKHALPRSLLDMLTARCDGQWDDKLFEKAIDLLQSYSLIKRETYALETDTMFSIHPLVYSWIRERPSSSHHGSSINITTQNHEKNTTKGAIIRYIFELALRSTQKETESDLRFRHVLYLHVESFKKAYPQILEIWGAETHSLPVAREMELISQVYASLGKRNEAEILVYKTWQAKNRLLGDEHPNTLKTMNNLA